MKTHKKALLLVLCAIVLAVGSVFGTLAYLTDTEAVTNTFSVGKVQITLDEAKVNTMGQPLNKDDEVATENDTPVRTSETQKYHLLPGHSYTKDPTVTVLAGSEESYVRMIVEVSFDNALTDAQIATDLDSIFYGYEAEDWPREKKEVSADKKTITYEYRYRTTVDGKGDLGIDDDCMLDSLFAGFKIPGEYTNEQIAALAGMEIEVTAHAIQAAGFDTADAAWTAFAGQHSQNN